MLQNYRDNIKDIKSFINYLKQQVNEGGSSIDYNSTEETIESAKQVVREKTQYLVPDYLFKDLGSIYFLEGEEALLKKVEELAKDTDTHITTQEMVDLKNKIKKDEQNIKIRLEGDFMKAGIKKPFYNNYINRCFITYRNSRTDGKNEEQAYKDAYNEIFNTINQQININLQKKRFNVNYEHQKKVDEILKKSNKQNISNDIKEKLYKTYKTYLDIYPKKNADEIIKNDITSNESFDNMYKENKIREPPKFEEKKEIPPSSEDNTDENIIKDIKNLIESKNLKITAFRIDTYKDLYLGFNYEFDNDKDEILKNLSLSLNTDVINQMDKTLERIKNRKKFADEDSKDFCEKLCKNIIKDEKWIRDLANYHFASKNLFNIDYLNQSITIKIQNIKRKFNLDNFFKNGLLGLDYPAEEEEEVKEEVEVKEDEEDLNDKDMKLLLSNLHIKENAYDIETFVKSFNELKHQNKDDEDEDELYVTFIKGLLNHIKEKLQNDIKTEINDEDLNRIVSKFNKEFKKFNDSDWINKLSKYYFHLTKNYEPDYVLNAIKNKGKNNGKFNLDEFFNNEFFNFNEQNSEENENSMPEIKAEPVSNCI